MAVLRTKAAFGISKHLNVYHIPEITMSHLISCVKKGQHFPVWAIQYLPALFAGKDASFQGNLDKFI